MFNGQNVGGKEFEVIDEDGDVLGSFAECWEAVECGKRAPWYVGKVNIRRDSRYAPVVPKLFKWWLVMS